MTLFASMQIALEAIKTNKMRSFLTMLGIIIGVASVITMVSVGSGAQNRVEEQINSLGSKMLMVWPGSGFGRGRHGGAGTARHFTEEDVDSILNNVNGVIAASGELSTNGQLVAGNENWASAIRGVQQDYMFIRDWFIQIGRNFSAREIRSAGKVVILGSTVAEELFGASNPIGQRIRIKNVPFNVIGVLAGKGQSSFGQDQDDVVFVPLATARNRMIGRRSAVARNVRTMYLKVGEDQVIGDVQVAMEDLLRIRRDVEPGEEDNFRVRNLAELINARNETQRIFSILLGATASISLLVGGIGIMNIMLVSVTERTREIGLRLAVGARSKDVLTQFLVEATTIAVIGGLIGISIGVGASQAISKFADWPTLLGPEIIVISAIFSAFVGIFFGYYPARKASRLNPIDALRFE